MNCVCLVGRYAVCLVAKSNSPASVTLGCSLTLCLNYQRPLLSSLTHFLTRPISLAHSLLELLTSGSLSQLTSTNHHIQYNGPNTIYNRRLSMQCNPIHRFVFQPPMATCCMGIPPLALLPTLTLPVFKLSMCATQPTYFRSNHQTN